jgi:hypothetical protein
MTGKIKTIYNKKCTTCEEAFVRLDLFCQQNSIINDYLEIEHDLIDSIETIVDARLSLDQSINQLPLIIFYENGEMTSYICGIASLIEFLNSHKV